MNSRWFQHMLIALAVLATQWAGLAHSIEHRDTLQAESIHGHAHGHAPSTELLHSCLLFDGLATAQAAVSNPPTSCALPLLAQLGIPADATVILFAGKFEPKKRPLDLLAASGVEYCCDWVNDDMPYAMRTEHGPLVAMPHPIDIDDTTILVQNHHTEDDFRDALIDQFDLLYREASEDNGRVMAISLHPWVIGQPYRIMVNYYSDSGNSAATNAWVNIYCGGNIRAKT